MILRSRRNSAIAQGCGTTQKVPGASKVLKLCAKCAKMWDEQGKAKAARTR
jgi:hypothetical protein